MDGQAKPISSKTKNTTPGSSEKTPVKLKSILKPDSAKKSDAPKSSEKKEGRQDSTGSAKVMAPLEIKKEVLSDDDRTGSESDDAPDDQRLVIDESTDNLPKSKSASKTDAKRTSSDGNDGKKKTPHKADSNKKTSVKETPDGKKSKKAKPAIRISLTPKGLKKTTPRPENGLNHSPSGDAAPSTSTGTATAKEVKTEKSFWDMPFEKGWRREIVYRATFDPKKKALCDVYYFAPCGYKLRSMPEILNYLKERGVNDLFLSNFTFMKDPIYHPPQEVTRQAKQITCRATTTTATPKATTPKATTPKVKKTTPKASPAVPAPTPSPTPDPKPSPITPITPFGETEVLHTKRWRKRKALPPDFVHTDAALSQRSPRFISPPPPPPPPPPVAVPTTTTDVSTPVATPPVSTTKIVKPTPVTSKETPITTTTTTPVTTATTTTSTVDDSKLPPNKRVIKRKIIMSPEVSTPRKIMKGIPVPIRRTPEAVATLSSGKNTTSAQDKNHSTNKVVFTFSRMGNKDNQAQVSAKYTVLRVNPLQNPCTLSCPGLQGQVPDLHCSVCLLLFHSQCVGCKHNFVCQRCKKLAQVGSPETPAPVMNGDSSHNAIEAPPPPEEKAEPIMPATNNTDYHFDKTSDDDQVLDEVDLASDDDDEDFMTVTPEVVMSSPIKEPSAAEPSGTQPKFIPPLPPLVRAPTAGSHGCVPRLPRLSAPPLVRPMITLTPPFGAASNQLRTLVSQLPPRPILAQGTPPMVAATCTTIATVVPLASSVGSPVTSFLAPVVTPSGINVNLLANSAPILVGSQVLTPVSITMPGIAKGTVIYTNNPTLRFLLPSSSGMQTFVPNKPVVASPPTAATTTTTTTVTSSTSSTPIVSPSEVSVSSKFLVQKPPLVINKKGRSLCELMLLVGKAEKGQKIKIVETDAPPEEELADSGEVKESADGEVKESADGDVKESADGDIKESVDVDMEQSADVKEGVKKSSESEHLGDGETVSQIVERTESGEQVGTDTGGSSEPPAVGEESAAATSEAVSVDSMTPTSKPATVSAESAAEPAAVGAENTLVTSEPAAVGAETAAAISKPTIVEIATGEPVAVGASDATTAGEPAAVGVGNATAAVGVEEAGEDQEMVDVEAKESSSKNEAEGIFSPVESTKPLFSNAQPEDAETSQPDTATSSSQVRPDPSIEEMEDIPDEAPLSPIFTEEEMRDWDRESVSSNDDEEEYRPVSPVVLATLPYQDGYTRVRSLALTNRGAQLSCPSGKCARASFYRRPVTDLYADQEHAYCSPRARQLFKQAGRKSMMTVNPPRRALHQIQSACDALSTIFEFLSTPDLLRASRVCRTWRKLASQPHQWATVKLKGLKVNNWKTCAKNLEFYGTTMLDMHGLDQDVTGWHQFVSQVHHLRKLQALIFGSVPPWVMQAVALALPQLLCLEAEYISSSCGVEGEVCRVDPGWWSCLPHLTVLRLRAPEGMTPAPFTPQGSFRALSSLNSLTHLSLTSLRSFPRADVDFLERLPQLQVLELGQCKEWNDQAYQRLGKLRSLRRLRLEMGGSQGDRGLANALGQMNRLEELTLLSFKVTTSLAASIRRLRHLWHLTIWPDMTSEGAMVVYNTLQAVRSLKKLQSFSWGIIFTENKEIRYSKKSTKYREAVDVHEWWSGELRKGHRAKSIKIPLLKAFSDEAPTSSKAGAASNSMEQGLIGVGHLKHKLNKLLPDVEIYVYQVPDNLLTKVYGTS